MTIQPGGETARLKIDRDLVLQIEKLKIHKGRRWYSIPLAVIAGAGGGAAAYWGIARHVPCSQATDENTKNCRKANGLIVGFSAAGPAALVLLATRGNSKKVIIYKKPAASSKKPAANPRRGKP
jgi:hypothetical protein